MRCLIFFALVAFCQSASLYSPAVYTGASTISNSLLGGSAGVGYQQLYGQNYPSQLAAGQGYYTPLVSSGVYQQYPYGSSNILNVLSGQYGQGIQQYPYGSSNIWNLLSGVYQGQYGQGIQQYPYGSSNIWNLLSGVYQGQYGQGLQQYPYLFQGLSGQQYPSGYLNYPYSQGYLYPYSQSYYYGQNAPLTYLLNNYLQGYQGQYPYYGIGQSGYYGNNVFQQLQQIPAY